jgi:hypothetical protein
MLGKLAVGVLFAAVAIHSHTAAPKAPPPDGTVVRSVGSGGPVEVAVMVGGARLPLAGPAEVAQAEQTGSGVKTLSAPAYQALPQRIADGTFVTTPGSTVTWVVIAGQRQPVPANQLTLKHPQVIPTGALERIPVVGAHR